MKKVFLLVTVLSVMVCSFASEMTKEKWIEDINFLKQKLFAESIFMKNEETKNIIFNKFDNLIADIDKFEDNAMPYELSKIVSRLNDMHTRFIFMDDKQKIIPVKISSFKEGYYIVSSLKEYEDVLDCKIVSINNMEIEKIEEKLSEIYPVETKNTIKNIFCSEIINIDLLKYLKFINNDEVNIVVEKNGKNITKIIKAVQENNSYNYIQNKETEKLTKNLLKFFWWEYRKKEKTVYIKLNRFRSYEYPADEISPENQPSFRKFLNEIFDFAKNKKVEKIVLDNRYNNGGAIQMFNAFYMKLDYMKNWKNKPKLYVFINHTSVSASVITSYYLYKFYEAKIIGETPAQSMRLTGYDKDPTKKAYEELPNSKLKIFIANRAPYFYEEVNIIPDYYVQNKFSDFIKGKDTYYEFLKTLK